MSQYVALRLRKLPLVSWVSVEDTDLELTEKVLVKTQHGVELATVLKKSEDMPEKTGDESEGFVSEIIGRLSKEDKEKLSEIAAKEKDAFIKARQKIEEHNLSMKLLKAEFLFDFSRVVFYFKSDSKVDFRELLKSLASEFKTRIELRQIGVRDEAKLLGGIGCCGKEVCCAQFMSTFYPVSTKMAKEQNLSLNPAKLSGICGRLLCCLAHEHEYYASFHGKYPKISAEVVIGGETARVMDINYITQKMLLGYADRRKAYFDLEVVKGRKDSVTGRNLWWIQLPGEEEPDLSILLKNLNPPGSGKKKKKSDGPKKVSKDSRNDKNPDSDHSEKRSPEVRPEKTQDRKPVVSDKKISDSQPEDENS